MPAQGVLVNYCSCTFFFNSQQRGWEPKETSLQMWLQMCKTSQYFQNRILLVWLWTHLRLKFTFSAISTVSIIFVVFWESYPKTFLQKYEVNSPFLWLVVSVGESCVVYIMAHMYSTYVNAEFRDHFIKRYLLFR